MAIAPLDKVYDPKAIEARWYRQWEEAGYFRCDPHDQKRPAFTIAIPPPNVTGRLHMGHALNNSVQDILVRWRRMQGYNALWQPGTDHAGIATQNVVEKLLAKEGSSRHKLGREKTVERIWQWKNEYGNAIVEQLRAMGCSCDWTRLRFTLDEGLSKAVREVFVRLYEKGWIYRGQYIINWCPRCTTALSDEESPKEEVKGKIYKIKYPIEGDTHHFIVVATTRPETMLGDTAVAVNPADERYRHLAGKHVRLPILNRKLPVVKDEYVDREFGTGVVKVTPAHDINDFGIGQRHGLERIIVMDPDGKMNSNAGHYAGLDRFACRAKLVEDLEAQGFLMGVEEHVHQVPHCDRCHTIVEPYLSTQWFVKMAEMAKPAVDAVTSGEIQFIPARWSKFYLDWMSNIRDWCISRQLWWGHQIPAWYCKDCDAITVKREDPRHCDKCKGSRLERDPDVLDTWFSSWLWPFSTLDWPDTQSAAYQRFYPTQVLSTDRGIIFFWVARMIMAGYEFCGQKPFSIVNIHGTVLDAQGRKMSKSLGNGIDPMDVVAKFGADAMRFSLMMLTKEGQDVKLSEQKLEMGRNFTNKIWNAARFLLMHLENARDLGVLGETTHDEDRWILSRLNSLMRSATGHLERVDLNSYCNELYHFFWNDFCDWYIELIKPRLDEAAESASRNQARQVLFHVLENALRLLHPVMPFITEELWQRVTALSEAVDEGRSIMIAEWPKPEAARVDEKLELRFGDLQNVVTAIRQHRSLNQILSKTRLSGWILPAHQAAPETDERWRQLWRSREAVQSLANIDWQESASNRADEQSSKLISANYFVVYLQGIMFIHGVDPNLPVELDRCLKNYDFKEQGVQSLESKLANEKFLRNARPEVVDKERSRLSELRNELENEMRVLMNVCDAYRRQNDDLNEQPNLDRELWEKHQACAATFARAEAKIARSKGA